MTVVSHKTNPNHQQDIELRAIDSTPEQANEGPELANNTSEMTKMNMLKIVAAGFSFFFAGTNDGSLGPLVPYILRTYHVGTQYIALM